jgi:hypothetical protein
MRVIAPFQNTWAQGNKPKTAEMASNDALRNAGMTDE